jgi:hypothetical protein
MIELIFVALFCLMLGIVLGALFLFLIFRNNPGLLAAWSAELAKAQSLVAGLSTAAQAASAEVKKAVG